MECALLSSTVVHSHSSSSPFNGVIPFTARFYVAFSTMALFVGVVTIVTYIYMGNDKRRNGFSWSVSLYNTLQYFISFIYVGFRQLRHFLLVHLTIIHESYASISCLQQYSL